MKHKKVAISVLLIVCAIIAVGVANTPENRTMRYFSGHRAVFEDDIIKSLEIGQSVSSLDPTYNYWDGEHPIVEYIVVSEGNVLSSKYYGFFYSFDDTPVSFQNADETLTPVSKQEWKWSGEGDNHGIVRRLDKNWFYFEASL